MRRYLATLRLEYPNLSASSFRLLHLHESTAELTATTGYSLKTAAGLRPTCSEFNRILHRGCPSGQFLFYANRAPDSSGNMTIPRISASYSLHQLSTTASKKPPSIKSSSFFQISDHVEILECVHDGLRNIHSFLI